MDRTLSIFFHYIYIYTFYQRKELEIQSDFIIKYIICFVCLGRNIIQLVTYGNKIELP